MAVYSTKKDNSSSCAAWAVDLKAMPSMVKPSTTIMIKAFMWNLFIPSEVNWKEKGMVLRQETAFPSEEKQR